MSWFITGLRSVRVGMILGLGQLTMSRLSAAAPSAHREAQIQQWACAVLQALGIQVRLQGVIEPWQLLVANHVSWLDAVVLHSLCPQARFVAKADVLRWPLIGRLAQGAGTLFVQRDRPRMAARIVSEVTAVLGSGGTPWFFRKARPATARVCSRFVPVSFGPCSPETARRSRSPCAISRERSPSTQACDT